MERDVVEGGQGRSLGGVIGLDDALSPRQRDCGTVQNGQRHREEEIEEILIDKLVRKAVVMPSSECV